MSAKIGRRNRRQPDLSQLPGSAPVMWALQWVATDDEQIARFQVINPFDGAAVLWTAAIAEPEWIDWYVGVDTVMESVSPFNFTGAVGIEITAPAGTFAFETLLKIPPWSETLRGPNGEWLQGQAIVIPSA